MKIIIKQMKCVNGITVDEAYTFRTSINNSRLYYYSIVDRKMISRSTESDIFVDRNLWSASDFIFMGVI